MKYIVNNSTLYHDGEKYEAGSLVEIKDAEHLLQRGVIRLAQSDTPKADKKVKPQSDTPKADSSKAAE